MAEMDEEKKQAGQVPQGDGGATGDAPGAEAQAGTGEQQPNGGDAAAVTFSAEQQAHIDQLIGERLKRAKEQWKAAADVAEKKAADAAEADRLKEQAKFKELSEKQAAQLAELEGVKPELERYKGALEQYAAKAREGLPEHLVPLLEKLDVVEQLAYLAEHGAAVGKPAAQVPETPNAAPGSETLDDAAKRKRSVGVRRVW